MYMNEHDIQFFLLRLLLKTLKKNRNFYLVKCDAWLFACTKLAEVGLNVCECAGKAKS